MSTDIPCNFFNMTCIILPIFLLSMSSCHLSHHPILHTYMKHHPHHPTTQPCHATHQNLITPPPPRHCAMPACRTGLEPGPDRDYPPPCLGGLVPAQVAGDHAPDLRLPSPAGWLDADLHSFLEDFLPPPAGQPSVTCLTDYACHACQGDG